MGLCQEGVDHNSKNIELLVEVGSKYNCLTVRRFDALSARDGVWRRLCVKRHRTAMPLPVSLIVENLDLH